jgi:hypothetical protein
MTCNVALYVHKEVYIDLTKIPFVDKEEAKAKDILVLIVIQVLSS